jgi:hypothetical protein
MADTSKTAFYQLFHSLCYFNLMSSAQWHKAGHDTEPSTAESSGPKWMGQHEPYAMHLI